MYFFYFHDIFYEFIENHIYLEKKEDSLIEDIFYLFCIFFLFLIPNKNLLFIRNFSFITSSIIFLVLLYILLNFDISSAMLQHSVHFSWSSFLNVYYSGGLDGVSLLFLVLTSFLIPLCILYSWNQFAYFFKEIILLLFSIEFLLFNFFFVSDLFFFLFSLKVFFFLCLF